MTSLGKLFRTTAFKLAVAYLAVFTLVAFLALAYLAWNANRVLDNEAVRTIEAEVRGLDEQYRDGGIRGLAEVIERRAQTPGASLYLLANAQGQPLAGNVVGLAAGVLDRPGARETRYRRIDEPDGPDRLAAVRVFVVTGGFRVLVGRDLQERQRLRQAVRQTFGWALFAVALLGALGAMFIARRVLARVDAMTATAQGIMAGNLERRLPMSGSGDELDRLALSLNSMLDRIGELMRGMKEVSDNIAHDLKTPLTRLRNRAEGALRDARDEAEMRRALDASIEDADNLIRVFNALLTIARLEAGNASLPMEKFDLGAVARELVEIYEPAAEEAGATLRVEAPEGLSIVGNRELVGQALANLIDNALKYGKSGASASDVAAARPADITVKAEARGPDVALIVADRGEGIPPEERERVLERYARREASRTQPGFGLGLSLVAAVARLHGGALTLADNAPGLVATVTLPNTRATA